MSWLKRCCWLAAWSGWLWLGVGLYRELPRDVGRTLWTIPLQQGETFWGFCGERQQVLTGEIQRDDKPIVLRVRNPESGSLIRRIDGPINLNGAAWKNVSFIYDGLILAQKRPPIDGLPEAKTLSVLDLETAAWRDLPVNAEMGRAYPWGKPWVGFYGRFHEDEPTRIVVYDLRTTKSIFSWTDRTKWGEPFELYRRPMFVGDSLLLIPLRKVSSGGEPAEERMELWSLTECKRLKAIPSVPFAAEPTISAAGRIAWSVPSKPAGGMDVFDVHEGRIVFSYPPDRTQAEPSGPPYAPLLSRDGRTIFQLSLDALFDVDSGRELWRLPDAKSWGPFHKREMLSFTDSGGNRITLLEAHSFPLVGRELTTHSVRSFADGEFLFRYWVSGLRGYYSISKDGKWAYSSTSSSIHHWPPLVNWWLLAFCQTCLALPILLVWTLTRWRRRRRLRLASATP